MSKIAGMTTGSSGTHKDRQGSKGITWGDNGAARPVTQEYKDNYDRIFGKKDKK